MYNRIRLVALDLDGTLLHSNKELPPENEAALRLAAERGVEIVPTTGRFFGGMPECVRALPFIHYAITVNGAQVLDLRQGTTLYRADIPWRRAVEVMQRLDTLPVIYDCYMDGRGYMTRRLQQKAEEFAPDAHYAAMIRRLRTPVDELKGFLAAQQHPVQKIQLFAKETSLQAFLLTDLPRRFPGLLATSSVRNNVELNALHANKGEALQALARALGIPLDATLAFGDGLNDISLLQAAGIGVAMGNAPPEVRAHAGFVTLSCDECGVAAGIRRFCFSDAAHGPGVSPDLGGATARTTATSKAGSGR